MHTPPPNLAWWIVHLCWAKTLLPVQDAVKWQPLKWSSSWFSNSISPSNTRRLSHAVMIVNHIAKCDSEWSNTERFSNLFLLEVPSISYVCYSTIHCINLMNFSVTRGWAKPYASQLRGWPLQASVEGKEPKIFVSVFTFSSALPALIKSYLSCLLINLVDNFSAALDLQPLTPFLTVFTILTVIFLLLPEKTGWSQMKLRYHLEKEKMDLWSTATEMCTINTAHAIQS